MKSVKPGRGPSFLGGIGALASAAFGVIWMAAAASLGAPSFFPLFGLIFVGLGVAQAIYHFKNATSKNRYSSFDITDGNEEPDPLNERFGQPGDEEEDEGSAGRNKNGGEINFCPYCGAEAAPGHVYCTKCGKKLS